MSSYKELFYKSQSEIADAIDSIEKILVKLKNCMLECEEKVMSEQCRIIHIEKENKDLQ